MKEFFQSKKVLAFLSGIISLFLADIVGLDDQTSQNIVIVIMGYLGAQGASDFGKEKAKVRERNKDAKK